MTLKDIIIRNFRGFDEKHFSFDPSMNVVLGDNTTGKTTLLHAVQISLGAYLQGLSLLPGGKGYTRNFRSNDQRSVFSKTNFSFYPVPEELTIQVFADFVSGKFSKNDRQIIFEKHPIQWTRIYKSNSKYYTEELQEEVSIMEKLRREADRGSLNSIFPLFLSFGAARLDKNYKGTEKTKARVSREAKAYKFALDERVDFRSAFDWIYRYEKNLAKGTEFEGTDAAFLIAVKEAIPAIKIIEIDMKNAEFSAQVQMTKDTSPYWLTYDMMSDGFKSMINIVAEIAYRCVQLNGFLGKEAVKKTPGIVMIDELDLYLHPHWQQHILSDLQKAFPMIQFLVTTHSPFIVQSVESKNVITLDGVQGDNDPNKRSIEEIVVSEMNMNTVRSAKYDEMVKYAELYYQLVKAGKSNTDEAKNAKKKLDEIEWKFSDEPAYVALLKAERNSI